MANTVARQAGPCSLNAPLWLMLGLLLAWIAGAARAAESAAAALPLAKTRYSALSELTPENVHALMPLSAIRADVGSLRDGSLQAGAPTRLAVAPLGSLVSADERLRQFVSLRVALSAAAAGRQGPELRGPAITFVASSAATTSALTAWDAARGRALWTASEAGAADGDAIVTEGGLFLYCSQSGWLRVLDARSGGLLWQYRLPGAARGTPVSYRGPDGHQYVAVLTDVHGPQGLLQPFALPH